MHVWHNTPLYFLQRQSEQDSCKSACSLISQHLLTQTLERRKGKRGGTDLEVQQPRPRRTQYHTHPDRLLFGWLQPYPWKSIIQKRLRLLGGWLKTPLFLDPVFWGKFSFFLISILIHFCLYAKASTTWWSWAIRIKLFYCYWKRRFFFFFHAHISTSLFLLPFM